MDWIEKSNFLSSILSNDIRIVLFHHYTTINAIKIANMLRSFQNTWKYKNESSVSHADLDITRLHLVGSGTITIRAMLGRLVHMYEPECTGNWNKLAGMRTKVRLLALAYMITCIYKLESRKC